MNHVERFRAVMDFARPDRLPTIEWAGYWDQTLARWQAEGLDPALGDHAAIRAHFGLDPYAQYWFGARGRGCPGPARHGAGIMADAADYARLEPCLFPSWPEETESAWRALASGAAQGDKVLWMTLEGFFWFPRTLFGIEGHLYAFYDEPELMHTINRRLAAFHLEYIDRMCARIGTPCFMTFAEDMSYNHGPMLSRALFDEFLAPYYRLVVPELKRRGIRVFVDSDGDVAPLIPWLREVGVEGILPLERMAGVDVAHLRREHPDWLMLGGFDKLVMKKGEAAMRAEFERLLPVMRGGGFLPGVDHQTPPDVSRAHYRIFLRLLREYAERACA